MADIVSVGIDIGTSTTQVVFSRLTMENAAGYFAVPRVSIVDKQVIYKGQVHTTPLKSPVLIDGAGVREIVAREYGRAGFRPADVETGAVIITGESARKENAAAVLSELSGFAGDFVVSTAGPDLESIIAGKGSGAWRCSLEEDCVAVNLDIGGGTTNIVAFDCGETVSTGCLDVGGRLIRLGEDLTVQSISPAAAAVAADLELELAVGGRTSLPTLRKITDRMADLLARALGLKPEDELLRHVRTPGSSWFVPPRRVRRVCFSGGVADCIGRQGGEDVPYGDIGVLLGRSIAANPDLAALPQLEAAETIRATVVGAGTYTTTISGSTIDYVAELLPMKNLPVLKLTAGEERRCYEGESSPWRRRSPGSAPRAGRSGWSWPWRAWRIPATASSNPPPPPSRTPGRRPCRRTRRCWSWWSGTWPRPWASPSGGGRPGLCWPWTASGRARTTTWISAVP